MKEFYIAPEVEILCFAPVEALANQWNWSNYSIRSGSDYEDESGYVEIPETDHENGDE